MFILFLVPPDIIDAESSSDVRVKETENVSLRCKAKGYPEPSIRWRREDGEKIILRKGRKEKTKGKNIYKWVGFYIYINVT